MSRSNAMPFDQASETDTSFDDLEEPTVPVRASLLPDENADATVTIGAEQNRRLLSSVFAVAENWGSGLNTDDEPTLDVPVPLEALEALRERTPAPPEPEPEPEPEPKRSTRPPPLRSLVLTSPPPRRVTPRLAVAPEAVIALDALPRPAAAPESGWRKKIAPQLAEEEAGGRSAAVFKVRLPKRDTETLIVAGIWATALSLIALLMFIVSSA